MCGHIPPAWVSEFNPGSGVGDGPSFVWDYAGNVGGYSHAVAATGYDPDGLIVCSWGSIGRITDRAIADYFNDTQWPSTALYTVLDHDWVNRATQQAPSGLDWHILMSDFNITQTATTAPSNTVSA